MGEYDEELFLLKRVETPIQQEQLREQAAAIDDRDETECQAHLFDLLAAWDAAGGAQRTRLLAGLFNGSRRRPSRRGSQGRGGSKKTGWRRFLEYAALELQTVPYSNSGEVRRRLAELAAAAGWLAA